MSTEPSKPNWLKETNESQTVNLGGITFQKELLEKSVLAAKESGIENEDILKQTAFNIYHSQRSLKLMTRIKNNVIFWFWITAGWFLILLAGTLGISAITGLSSLF
jgi:hypothetical protein